MKISKIIAVVCLAFTFSACSTSGGGIMVTDIRGKIVNPNTLMCKSIGEIGDFSGGNAILSNERTNQVRSDDLLVEAKKMGATHVRWRNLGKKGNVGLPSGEAYRCIFHTKEFRKSFAANRLDE